MDTVSLCDVRLILILDVGYGDMSGVIFSCFYTKVIFFFLSYRHYCWLLIKNPNLILFCHNVGNRRVNRKNDSIPIQRLCDNWCITRQSSNNTSHYLCNWRIYCTFKKAKCWNSVCVHCDVVSLSHSLTSYTMKQCIKGAPSASVVPLYHTHWVQPVHVCHHSNVKWS